MLKKEDVLIVQKAMIYDIKRILKADSDQPYTIDEIEAVLDAYIAEKEQQS